MTKTLTTLAAAAAVAIAAVAVPTQADAHWRGGGAVAAGVIGGLAAGALIAGAARPAYGYGYGYGPAYYPAPVYGPACHWRRERVWDGYGWRIRRVQVCY
jgi:hypothetical protein